jgi:hypothetical protein
MVLMERTPLVSLMIRSVGYDRAAFILEIEFRSGKVYRYEDVPEKIYLELMAANSKGHYFEEHIKGAGYAYQRV